MRVILSIKNLSKEFETKDSSILALDHFDLDIMEGEIVALIGPSGCGKSTLLNIISGLDEKTGGTLEFASDEPKISYMLQSDALLPWRTVLENATLGLELSHKKDVINAMKVKDLLIEYGLEDFLDKKPGSLSGGMRQRVALIRSLAIEPDILLLDEPFSALDYYTRLAISEDVHDIIKKSGKTAIVITHDIGEAITIADRVVVLTDRPSRVKNIYEVDMKELSCMEKRENPKYNELFKKIWGDLNDKV